jgi:hypothetical protein
MAPTSPAALAPSKRASPAPDAGLAASTRQWLASLDAASAPPDNSWLAEALREQPHIPDAASQRIDDDSSQRLASAASQQPDSQRTLRAASPPPAALYEQLLRFADLPAPADGAAAPRYFLAPSVDAALPADGDVSMNAWTDDGNTFSDAATKPSPFNSFMPPPALVHRSSSGDASASFSSSGYSFDGTTISPALTSAFTYFDDASSTSPATFSSTSISPALTTAFSSFGGASSVYDASPAVLDDPHLDAELAALCRMPLFTPSLASASCASLPARIAAATPTVPSPPATAAPAPRKRRLSHDAPLVSKSKPLLPLSAPIQPRKYRAPSSTSRLDAFPTSPSGSVAPTAGGSNDDARRRANTLAARRSRLRKNAEREELLSQIEELRNEVETWKRRCLRAEGARDARMAAAAEANAMDS